MVATKKTLPELCAVDLMSRNLVAIPMEMSLQGAARILSRAEVTGAPVVDGEGKCVGVLSTSDFMHFAEEGRPSRPGATAGQDMCSAWQIYDPNSLPDVNVQQIMTPDPVMVELATPLGEIAWKMLEAHIHRVIVVNHSEVPVGVVSTFDVLSALARHTARLPEETTAPCH